MTLSKLWRDYLKVTLENSFPFFQKQQRNISIFLFSIVVIVVLINSYRNFGLQLDDALIYQRYVRNFIEGNGLTYNVGEYFNALTSPLFSYITIIISSIFRDAHTGVMVNSTLFTLFSIAIFSFLFSRYCNLYFVASAAAIMATVSNTYINYGMETSQFTFFIGLTLYLFYKNNYFWLGISCALLLLTRSEGIFLIIALAIEHFRRHKPFPPLRYFVFPSIIILSHFSFNYITFHSFFPNSASAKIYHGLSGWWGNQMFVKSIYKAIVAGNNHYIHVHVAVSILGFLSLKLKSMNIVVMLFLVMYTLFYMVFNIPPQSWYYGPYFVFSWFYSALGFYFIWEKVCRLLNKPFKVLVTCCILFLCIGMPVFLHHNLQPGLGHVTRKDYRDIGLWLKNNTDKNASIAMVEIGTVGWYSERIIIDILGLVNPKNAAYIGKRDFLSWMKHYQPDYILVHDPLWSFEKAAEDAEKKGQYVNDVRFAFSKMRLLKKS